MEFDLEDQFELGDLLLSERRCRVCGSVKNLVEDFYLTHKTRTHLPSRYSYECKSCTVKRITSSRKKDSVNWVYPDW